MSLPVFHAPDLAGAAVGGTVQLEGDEARHAVVVRRHAHRASGWRSPTAPVRRSSVTVDGHRQDVAVRRPWSTGPSGPRRMPRLVVVQAIAKGDRGELAVEMLTEVGADVVVPWAASRSVAVWRGERAAKSLAKWRSTAREAAKQARRAWFPVVEEMAGTAGRGGPRCARRRAGRRSPRGAARVPLADLDVPAEGDVVVVVGPEGGIDEEELAAFAEAGAGPVRLGTSVLRTSTAGVAAGAALLSRTARWR